MKNIIVLAFLFFSYINSYSQFGNLIGKSNKEIKKELRKSTFSFIEKNNSDSTTYSAMIIASSTDSSMTFVYMFLGDDICRNYTFCFKNMDYVGIVSDLAKVGYKRFNDFIFQTDKYQATILNPNNKTNFLVKVELTSKE